MKRLRLPPLWAAFALLGGCANAPLAPLASAPSQLFEDSAFAAPSQPIDVAQIFAISPAMKHYLDVEIAAQLRRMGRQRGLVDALYAKAQLRLEYDTESTRNAAQAFDARSGNCLSLVVMSAALAKYLDLPIRYQALIGEESWSRSGGLSIVNGHVNIVVDKRLVDRVGIADQESPIQLSFGTPAVGRGAALRPVSESTIEAMFMNNRAAEALVQGRIDDAYAHARQAIVVEPTYYSALNTLGVIYQRRGLAQAAERAYAYVLTHDEKHLAAMTNLARLLELQGRSDEAATWRARLARLEAEPPFHYFDLGRAALLAGDYRAAREYILREMRRDPDYHEFHFWLALALYGLGEYEEAGKHLAAARDNSTTRREQSLYSANLQALKASATRTQ
jgi:tetratricopeptide (TPR) repeat protein